MKWTLIAACCVSALLNINDLHAASGQWDEIVVTATRTEVQQANVPSSITVITAKDIEDRHAATLTDLLTDIYGIDVIRRGGAGQLASVFIRGAESRHTLVLIDDVRVNSPAAGGFDFADLTTDNIERIEIVRGPLSALYGSGAIGGVIQIFTKKAAQSSAVLNIESGSYNTTREAVSTGVKKERYDVSLAASHTDADSFSALKSGAERDAYQNTTISSRVGMYRGAATRVDITARLSESTTGLDNPDSAVNPDDTDYQQQRRHSMVGITLASPMTNSWSQRLSLSSSDDRLIHIDESTVDNSRQVDTGIRTVDWQHNIMGDGGNQIIFGYEWEQRDGEIRGGYNKSYANHAVYLQEQRGLATPAQLLAGIRWDESTIYEDTLTYRFGISYLPEEGAKWHAQYGTGFDAPTLNEMFSPLETGSTGNPDLRPEKSSGWEVGVEEKLSDNMSLSLIYYENTFEDLIQIVQNASGDLQPMNRAMAESKGMEADLTWHLSSRIRLDWNYTYNDTRDSESHYYLPWRPLNKYNLTFRLNPHGRNRLTFNLLHVGERVEWGDKVPDQQISLPAYSKADLLASFSIRKTTEIYVRMENLFDREYEVASGYGTSGFSTYGGLRMAF